MFSRLSLQISTCSDRYSFAQRSGELVQLQSIVLGQLYLEGCFQAALLQRRLPAFCLGTEIGAATRLLARQVDVYRTVRSPDHAQKLPLAAGRTAGDAGALWLSWRPVLHFSILLAS